MKVESGTYRTNGGQTAHVWEQGKDFLNRDCWKGTVEGVGMSTWDDDGKDLSDCKDLDLKKLVKKGK